MKKISIMGDSISTYEGFNPPGYHVYYTPFNRRQYGLYSVNDTWWWRVIKKLGGELCVCAGYSGGMVSGIDFPAACCQRRIDELSGEKGKPDIILCYIGTNDYGYGVNISGDNETSFAYAYELMIKRMKNTYPDADIVCATLMKPEEDFEPFVPVNGKGYDLYDYNRPIREACRRQKVFLADLADDDIRFSAPGGSIHPNRAGHKTIADQFISELNKFF